MRKVIRKEKHHWWPKSLSKYWTNEKGMVNRLEVNEEVITSHPKNFGQISDGHNLIFPKKTSWDSTIEGYFDKPDGDMPKIVSFLEKMRPLPSQSKSTFQGEGTKFNELRQCLVSLIVRCPMYRNSIRSFLERFHSDLDEKEFKSLIASNIHQKYDGLVNSSKNLGKLVVLYSDNREFIFGDGFFSDISCLDSELRSFRVIIPLTPNIAIIWVQPKVNESCTNHSLILADPDMVETINYATQVYSKDYIFYRSSRPTIFSEFKEAKHITFANDDNPVEKLLIFLIPDLRSDFKSPLKLDEKPTKKDKIKLWVKGVLGIRQSSS